MGSAILEKRNGPQGGGCVPSDKSGAEPGEGRAKETAEEERWFCRFENLPKTEGNRVDEASQKVAGQLQSPKEENNRVDKTVGHSSQFGKPVLGVGPERKIAGERKTRFVCYVFNNNNNCI